MSRNVSDYKPTLRNIPEEQKSHLHRNGSLKSCTYIVSVLQDAWGLTSGVRQSVYRKENGLSHLDINCLMHRARCRGLVSLSVIMTVC
jgi:hypothetical protein